MSFGQRLRRSRRAAGLSLRDLQAKINNHVTAQAISKYERDESMPGSGVLIALASALGVSVDYLSCDAGINLGGVGFPRRLLTSRREEAQVEARVLDRLERYLTVEELLDLPTVTRNLPPDAPWPVLHDAAEAEPAAVRLRSNWGLGLGPIPKLVDLLEERGIKVLSMPLSDIDGLTTVVRHRDRNIASVIVVDCRDWGERQRFTLAQELGHMVLEVSPNVDNEKAARRFAGAFLVPAEALRAEIGKHRHRIGWSELFELKRVFGVSVQSLTNRCKDLGIIGNPLYRHLSREFTRRGWRSPPYKEPNTMDGEVPRRFERLCFRALAEGAVFESRAAELLGSSVHELGRLMDEPPGMEAGPSNA